MVRVTPSTYVTTTKVRTWSAWPVAIALILGLAAALRLIGLSRYGFDGDEIFSVKAASAGWVELIDIAAENVSHPPLFYMLLKLWLGLGPPSEEWVRLLSVALGVGSLVIVAGMCSALRFSRVDTVFVLLLMAVNGYLIYYSQHARMFALLEFTSSLSLYQFLSYARRPLTPMGFIAVVAVDLLVVYSHYWGWLFLIGECLAMLYISRAKAVAWVAASCVAAIGYVPWGLALMHAIASRGAATTQIEWMGRETPGIINYAWLFGELNGDFKFEHSTPVAIALFAIPIAAFIIQFLSRRAETIERVASPLPWLIVIATPMLLTSVGSALAKQDLWGDRHMIIVAAPYFILLALSLGRSPWPKLAMAARAVLLLWSLCAGAESLASPHHKLDWIALAKSVTTEVSPLPPIYAADFTFVGKAMHFHVARLLDGKDPVVAAPDPWKITADRFWFVYRNITWKEPLSPQALFEARGYRVDHELSTTAGNQTVTAIFVHK
jgi:hypothetical protein